jgi:eukaryotic-like serine/threonine-protein kinase
MTDERTFTGLQLSTRYHVNTVLARGSVATVYDGTDGTLARRVAIKVVPPAHVATYRGALEATAALTHPSVLMTIDALEHEGWLFLVQELVPRGAPLTLQLATGLSVPRALELGTELCRTLAYAHAHSIIHGDVTPTAVLLDGDDTLHLNNFGLPTDATYHARAARIEAHLAQSLSLPAPAAEEAEPSAAEDLRAVGVLLWQTLASPDASGGALEVRPEVPGKVRQLLARLIVRAHPERLSAAEDAALAIEARLREVEVARQESAPATPSLVRTARDRATNAPEAEWSTAETQVVNTAWSALPQSISAASLIESDVLGAAPTVPMATQPAPTGAPPSSPATARQMTVPPAAPPSNPMRPPVVSRPLHQAPPSGPQWNAPPSGPLRGSLPQDPLPTGVASGPLHGTLPPGALRPANPSGALRPANPSGPLRTGVASGPLRGTMPSTPLSTGALRNPHSQPLDYHPRAAVPWSDEPAVMQRWTSTTPRPGRGGPFGASRTGRGAALSVTQVVILGVLLFVLGFLVMFVVR